MGITPPASFRGRSLLPAVDGQPLPPRPLFGELLPASSWPKHEVMIVDQGKKLTHKITERRWELHDLASDPRQQKDLSGDPRHQKLLEALQGQAARLRGRQALAGTARSAGTRLLLALALSYFSAFRVW